jgi:hypothetical protein
MAAARKYNIDDERPMAWAWSLRSAMSEILLAAVAQVPELSVEQTVTKWFAHISRGPDDKDAALTLMAEAATLAHELALYVPSLSGARPIDRLSRQFKAKSHDQALALELLTKAKFKLFRIVALERSCVYRALDLASGEPFQLFEQSLSVLAQDRDLAARLCPIGHGLEVMVGPMIPLSQAILAAQKEFIRPGRGLVNDQRCAALVYRDTIRHSGGGAVNFAIVPVDEPIALSHPDEELDGFALYWLESRQGGGLTGDDLNEVRSLTSGARLTSALFSSVELRRAGQERLAEIYGSLAAIQMETLQRRARIASGETDPLDSLRATYEKLAARERFPREAVNLFRALSGKIRREIGGSQNRDEDLSRVIERIKALRAKTTAQGCTEQEALRAAEKVAELLDRYGLSVSEIEFRNQSCEGFGIDTGRRQRGPVDRCVTGIASFCDCRVWSETSQSGTVRYVFFGLPADVEAAHYLYDLVAIAFDTETVAFRAGATFGNMLGGERRGAVASFQIGLAIGISEKLAKLKVGRQAAMHNSTGRDLVPVKVAILDEEFDKLGLSLHAKRTKRRRTVIAAAFEEGQVAGGKFEVHAGIK